jgi:hypothetical protein
VFILDGDQKGVDAVMLALDDGLCEDDGVVCYERELSGPVLGGRDGGGIYGPLLGCDIILGNCLETADVRAVADFCLSIASNDLAFLRLLKIELFVLFSTHEFDVGDEHAEVDHAWDLVRVRQIVIDMSMEGAGSFNQMVPVVVVNHG